MNPNENQNPNLSVPSNPAPTPYSPNLTPNQPQQPVPQPQYPYQPQIVTPVPNQPTSQPPEQPPQSSQLQATELTQSPAPQPKKPFQMNKKKWLIFGGIIAGIVAIVVTIIIIIIATRPISRTVMIYMAGADLESRAGLASTDLASLSPQNVDEKTKVVLIAGGSKQWDNDYIDTSETSIFELQNSGFKKVKQQSRLNMGDSKTLSDFLNYVYDNYKTDKYDLVFWDHGAAMMGNEFDELSGDNLELNELGSALKESKFNGNKLELLIFRTCLNGTIEMADTFKNYADYMVASEEVTYGSSQTSVLNFLNNVTGKDSAIDVGKKYINSYKQQIATIKDNAHYFGNDSSIYSTYSILDLAKVPQLEKSLNDFFGSVDPSSSFATISKARSNLYQYAKSSDEAYDMVDLRNLVDSIHDLSDQKANALTRDLENTVVYNWATNEQSRGVSIYFPYYGEKRYQNAFLNIYDKLKDLGGYGQFISKFASTKQQPAKTLSFNNNKTSVAPTEKGFNFSIDLVDEQTANFAKAKYILMRKRDNGNYEPVYIGTSPTLTGNSLVAPIGKYVIQAADRSDPSTHYVTLTTEEESGNDYVNYRLSAIIDRGLDDLSKYEGMNIDIGLQQNLNNQSIGISKVAPLHSQKTQSLAFTTGNTLLNLAEWERVQLLDCAYPLVDEDNNFHIESWQNGEYDGTLTGVEISGKDLYFELADFTNDLDKYYGVFAIYNIDGSAYYSKVTKLKGE